MKHMFQIRRLMRFANDNACWIPEVWAQEALMQLEPNLVMGNLVYKDFSKDLASYGEVVNANKPQTFTMKRKRDGEAVTTQDAKSTTVPVRMDQWGHVSFTIKDGESSKSFAELIPLYIQPATVALARGIEQALLAQKYKFMSTFCVGKFGTSLPYETPSRVQTIANLLNWPVDGRNAVITPIQAGQLGEVKEFATADKVGDQGTALRTGSLGSLFNTQFVMSQNNATVEAGSTTTTGAVDLNAGYPKGTATLIVKSITGAVSVGQWITITGDNTPHRITAHTETAGDTTGITISPVLTSAVADDAVITIYSAGAINHAAGYSADALDCDDLVVNGFSVAPKLGQLATFGSVATPYSIFPTTTPTTTLLSVDRPLEADVAHAATVNLGPSGEYGFVFNRNALALVTRPLALPMANTGAVSGVASYNGLSIRVTIGYDMTYQQTRVTLDLLYGIKQLNANLGFLLYA